jgi:hypothetical protein
MDVRFASVARELDLAKRGLADLTKERDAAKREVH